MPASARFGVSFSAINVCGKCQCIYAQMCSEWISFMFTVGYHITIHFTICVFVWGGAIRWASACVCVLVHFCCIQYFWSQRLNGLSDVAEMKMYDIWDDGTARTLCATIQRIEPGIVQLCLCTVFISGLSNTQSIYCGKLMMQMGDLMGGRRSND